MVFAHWTSSEVATPVPAPSKALGGERVIFTLEELVVRIKGIPPQPGGRQAGGCQEGPSEVRKELPGLASDLARLGLCGEAERVSWHLVQACLSQVGSWHGNPCYWIAWLRAPRRGTSLPPISQFAFWATFTSCEFHAHRRLRVLR